MRFLWRGCGLLFTIVFMVQMLSAQNQRNLEDMICLGDSCAQALNYIQAKKFYFDALTMANAHPTAKNRQMRKDLGKQIHLMDRHLHFASVLQNAKMLEDMNDLKSARIFYTDAINYARKENLENEPLDSLNERMVVLEKVMGVYDLLQDAKDYEAVSDYKKTRKSFSQAYAASKKVRPQLEGYGFSPAVVARLDSLSQFMHDRQAKTFLYKNIFAADYDTIRTHIQRTLSNAVSSVRNFTTAKIVFTSRMDTVGRMFNEYSSSTQDTSLLQHLKTIARDLQFKRVYQNGMTIAAQDTFSYDIDVKEWQTSIVKNSCGMKVDSALVNPFKERLKTFLSSAPKGKFIFALNRIFINDDEYDKIRLVKVRGLKARKWISENTAAVRCHEPGRQDDYILNIL